MSKQLAISSSFATFAMAAMALLYAPDHSGQHGGEGFVLVQAEIPSLDLPRLSLFRD